jgi:hypothetical protein
MLLTPSRAASCLTFIALTTPTCWCDGPVVVSDSQPTATTSPYTSNEGTSNNPSSSSGQETSSATTDADTDTDSAPFDDCDVQPKVFPAIPLDPNIAIVHQIPLALRQDPQSCDIYLVRKTQIHRFSDDNGDDDFLTDPKTIRAVISQNFIRGTTVDAVKYLRTWTHAFAPAEPHLLPKAWDEAHALGTPLGSDELWITGRDTDTLFIQVIGEDNAISDHELTDAAVPEPHTNAIFPLDGDEAWLVGHTATEETVGHNPFLAHFKNGDLKYLDVSVARSEASDQLNVIFVDGSTVYAAGYSDGKVLLLSFPNEEKPTILRHDGPTLDGQIYLQQILRVKDSLILVGYHRVGDEDTPLMYKVPLAELDNWLPQDVSCLGGSCELSAIAAVPGSDGAVIVGGLVTVGEITLPGIISGIEGPAAFIARLTLQ